MAATQFYGTGRRKTSVARVWLRPGGGRILVNRRPFEDYFPRETLRMIIAQPLQQGRHARELEVVGGILRGRHALVVDAAKEVIDRCRIGQRGGGRNQRVRRLIGHPWRKLAVSARGKAVGRGFRNSGAPNPGEWDSEYLFFVSADRTGIKPSAGEVGFEGVSAMSLRDSHSEPRQSPVAAEESGDDCQQ